MKYKKKPVVVDAFQLGIESMPDWFMDGVAANRIILSNEVAGFGRSYHTNAYIETLEGWHHAGHGDYVIRGVKGEIYPCKPDISHMTYEEAADGV